MSDFNTAALGRLRYSCSFPECKNRYYQPITLITYINKKFHRCPKDPVINFIWKQICNLSHQDRNMRFYVCEDHFERSSYIYENNHRLRLNACPTTRNKIDFQISTETEPTTSLYNPSCSRNRTDKDEVILETDLNSLNQNESNIFSQTDILKRKLNIYRAKLRNKEAYLSLIKKSASDNAFKVNQIFCFNNSRLSFNKILRSRKWTVNDKKLALLIYKRTPHLYKHLKAYFVLPSIRISKNMPSLPADYKTIIKSDFEKLNYQVKYTDELQRCCILVIDEINQNIESNKEQISSIEGVDLTNRKALIFTIKDMSKKYNQVVAYFVYNSVNSVIVKEIKQLIVNLIQELQKIRFNVVAIACDQNSTNTQTIQALRLENEQDSCLYHFVVNRQKIAIIYKVPSLLINTRNALIDNFIQYDTNKYAKFQYIIETSNLDQQKRIYKQIKLNNPHYNFKDLPGEAINTAEFVEFIDELFDSLNGSVVDDPDGKKFHGAISATSLHLEFWSEAQRKINKWKIIDPRTGSERCHELISGWQITIQAAAMVWKILRREGLRFLFLRDLIDDQSEDLSN